MTSPSRYLERIFHPIILSVHGFDWWGNLFGCRLAGWWCRLWRPRAGHVDALVPFPVPTMRWIGTMTWHDFARALARAGVSLARTEKTIGSVLWRWRDAFAWRFCLALLPGAHRQKSRAPKSWISPKRHQVLSNCLRVPVIAQITVPVIAQVPVPVPVPVAVAVTSDDFAIKLAHLVRLGRSHWAIYFVIIWGGGRGKGPKMVSFYMALGAKKVHIGEGGGGGRSLKSDFFDYVIYERPPSHRTVVLRLRLVQ